MENLRLPHWSLAVRLESGRLECLLTDGQRLAVHAGRALELIGSTAPPQSVEQWLGGELAQRLARSPPRSLSILYNADPALDQLPWEQLKLGEASLAEHFALSRQLQAGSDPGAGAALQRTDRLDACWLHAGRPPTDAPAKLVAWEAALHGGLLKPLQKAHVLLLDGLSITRLLEATDWPQRQRLLLVSEPVSLAELLAALETGAAVLHLGLEEALGGPATQTLLAQLSRGISVGEAVQSLHRRAPGRCTAKLYGDPQMAFVHAQGQTSRRQVSSLSFDIVGSTALLAELGDEAYAELLAEVYRRCSEVVRRHGGQADEPQGDDGVMGYFGHPWAVEDAAVHAIDAGLEMVGAVTDLGIAVRVGIATGLVAVKAGLPFGLSIHLAARLQQAAFPGSVLAAAATQKLVAHAFQMQPLPIRPILKGIDDIEPVYQVLGRQAQISGPSRERRLAPVPMVGRQAELDRLHQCWQRTGLGHQRLAVVRAEAGMGKSRLVREFRHQLVTAGVKVLECRCRPDASASPFLSLAEALRRWLNIRDEDLGEPGLRKLVASLPEHARQGDALSWLAALLGLAPPPPAGLGGQFRQRLLGWLVDWFQAFAGTQTSCLIVEDWHWADPSMCEFVDHLMKGSSGPGLMVVVTVRSESDAAPFAALPHEAIELGGLSIQASRELLNHVCASQPLSARQVNLLAARGDGVPLFLEEAASMALELGVSGINVDPQALEAVPASLQDLLTARLDGLGSARSVAQVAAVLGRQVSRPLLAALLEASGQALDDVTLDNRLDQLVSSGLMRLDAPGVYAFRHALIRDAAYASLWARERVELHQKVVRLLQQRVQGAAPVPPELLALHQTEAGLHDQALAQWELAAGHAAARSAQHEAISHLRRALAALNHRAPGRTRDQTELRLQLHLASHLLAVEGYGADAVLKSYQQAQALCQRIGDDTSRFKVEMGLEAYRFMRAEFAPALAHGRRAEAIAQRSGDLKQRLHAHWGLACTLFHQGDLRSTMREMEAALTLYSPGMHTQFRIQDSGVMCMAYSAWGLWEQGRPDAALARINLGVQMAEAFDHRFSQAVTLSYGVSILLLRGEIDAALQRAERSLQVCEESGFPVWQAITRCMRGYLLCERGEFDVGLPEMQAGHQQWLSTGALVSQPLYLALQAQGLMLAGQWELAAARVNEGLSLIERFGERQLQAELTRLRGELALHRGAQAEALVCLKQAYALALRQRKLGFALRSATSLARLWAAQGQAQRARRLLEPLLRRWHEGLDTRDLRQAQALISELKQQQHTIAKEHALGQEEETSSPVPLLLR